jgi:CHAD domain-containing protein
VSDREVELKYNVADPAAVGKLIATESIAGLRVGRSRTQLLVDRYLDTPSRSLERAGYGARLRHVDRHTVLTVKSLARRGRGAKTQGALHDRLELEGRATASLDPERWPESGARALLKATVGEERMRTLFVVEQRREERELTRDDGSVVARLSLDQADVRRFGRRLGSFWTLEVESAQPDGNGSVRALESIAADLESSGLLTPETRSKEEIGLAMVAAASAARTPVRPPRQAGVRADDDLAEAGRKVLRMHLLRMLETEPGVRAGEDIEAVHRMRVATRRMRAAWRVFNGAYRPRLQGRYVRELRVVATALGAVRDIDVQLDRLATHAKRTTADDTAALEPLLDEWRRRRAEARATLLGLLASREYDHFVADYRRFVETTGAGAVGGQPRRVVDAAGARIWRAYERLRAHDATLRWADVAAIHAVRIDGKRLRYTLEFFREVLPSTTDRLIAEITALQDHLGTLNDAQVAADLTRAWLIASRMAIPNETRLAAGAYLEASEAEVAHLRRAFRPTWRRVVGAPFRRRLALAVGSL